MTESNVVKIPEREVFGLTTYTENEHSPTIKVGSRASLGKDKIAKYGLTTRIEVKMTEATFIVKRILNMVPETVGKGPTLVTNSDVDSNQKILTIIVLEYTGEDTEINFFLKKNRVLQSRKNTNLQKGEFAVLPSDIVKII